MPELPFEAKSLPEEKKPGLFAKKPEAAATQFAEFSNQMTTLNRRLRVLEERYEIVRNKTQVTDQNMLSFQKELMRELKATQESLTEFHREFTELRDKARLIVKELRACAKQEDVQVLEKYIQIWEPLQFVTRQEVERLVENAMQETLQLKQIS